MSGLLRRLRDRLFSAREDMIAARENLVAASETHQKILELILSGRDHPRMSPELVDQVNARIAGLMAENELLRHPWRPIETASKDGAEVDLWMCGRRHADCRWQDGAWREYDDLATDWVEIEQTTPLRDGRSWRATHWMPKPSPPPGESK